MATGVPIVFVSVGDNTQDGDLGGFLGEFGEYGEFSVLMLAPIDITNALIGESGRPQVMTTSYGSDERDISITLAEQVYLISSGFIKLIATYQQPSLQCIHVPRRARDFNSLRFWRWWCRW